MEVVGVMEGDTPSVSVPVGLRVGVRLRDMVGVGVKEGVVVVEGVGVPEGEAPLERVALGV